MDVISFMLQTPLYGAAENGHTAVVEMLLRAGADMNKVSHSFGVCYANHSWLMQLNGAIIF